MQITEGLLEEYRMDAAKLYWIAFAGKLGKLLGPSELGIAYFADIINLNQAIGAFDDDGTKLLGLVGFDLGAGGIIGGGYRELARHYGIFGAIWRGVILDMLTREVAPNSLQMDGITTAPEHRGMGVGTALLEAIFAKAKSESKSSVFLDVIDTNPRARALYQRMGFELIKTENIGPLKRVFGFERSFKMRKLL